MTAPTSMTSTKKSRPELTIEDVGPIPKFEAKCAAAGIVEILGPNGSGKSTVLAAVDRLTTGRGKLTPRDRAKLGSVVWGKLRLEVGTSTLRKGELDIRAIPGDKNPLPIFVDPGIQDPESANAARIRALLQLTAIEPDTTHFYSLVGGKEEFDRVVAIDVEDETDIVKTAARVKRRLDEVALGFEQRAEQSDGQARGHKDAADGVDLDAPHDAVDLGRALEEAIAAEQAEKTRAKAYETAVNAAKEAKADLDQLISEFDGKTAEVAALEEKQFAEMVKSFEGEVQSLEGMLREAKKLLADAKASHEQSKLVRQNAEQHERAVDTLRRTIANSLPEQPREGALEQATANVKAAREAVERGTLVRKAKLELQKANDAKTKADEHRRNGEKYRNAAANIDGVLSSLVSATGSPLRIHKGRLVVDTESRGVTDFAELSQGERWKIALDIAIETLKSTDGDGVLVIDQEAYEGLDPENRIAIHRHLLQAGVLAFGALADSGKLRAEAFAEENYHAADA